MEETKKAWFTGALYAPSPSGFNAAEGGSVFVCVGGVMG